MLRTQLVDRVAIATTAGLRSRVHRPPLFSRRSPWGEARLSTDASARVRRHNQFVRSLLRCVRVCVQRRIPFLWSQPCESLLWELPPFRLALAQQEARLWPTVGPRREVFVSSPSNLPDPKSPTPFPDLPTKTPGKSPSPGLQKIFAPAAKGDTKEILRNSNDAAAL